MVSMERDAQERSERRKVKEKEATVHKEQGNQHFKAGEYEKALQCYTKVLACSKLPRSCVYKIAAATEYLGFI